ncbi:MFS transporter [Paraoerskovia marina]|uniref:MFS transporter n=1 Tax=Paraoerskovia marina TaxID=545619 RepID=UPI000694105C|nr:MFS transporter [Paraoerskovia marina]
MPSLTSRGRATTLVGLVTIVALGAFETLAVATAMPAVAADLDGLRFYGLTFAATIAASVVSMVAAGPLTDRRGPAVVLLGGVGLFAAGLLVAGSAPTIGAFLAGRVLQGLGSGAYIVAVYVVVARTYDHAERPRVFAWFSAAWVVPALVGPAVAGLIVEHAGWRWVYWGVAVVLVPAVLMVAPSLRRDGGPTGTPGPVDPEDRRRVVLAVVAACGVGALHLAAGSSGAGAVVLGVVGAAAVLLTVAAILPAGTFRAARGIPTAVGINALTSTAFLTAESVLPLLLVTHHGLSAATAGLALTFAAVGWSSASWFRGHNPFDVGAVGFLRAGALALVIGIGGAATLTIPAVPSAVGMAAWAVTGIGMGLTSPTLSVLVLDLAEPGRQGAAASALQTGNAVVAAPALAVVGAAVWMLRDAGTWGFVVVFALATACAAAAFVLAPRAAAGPGPDLDGGPGDGPPGDYAPSAATPSA